MISSYDKRDVEMLLKDITGMVEPMATEEREKRIQAGCHYSEMLPLEYKPSAVYMNAYEEALNAFGGATAMAVAVVAARIVREKGDRVALVSLARAGVPVGILIKRYLKTYYNIEASHYGISIIRGRGIDKNAMNYILERHAPEDIQFVDGWIGKGAILGELKKDMVDFPGVSSELAVLADPAFVTDMCGTHEDILVPSSCLNSTVSGLMSRTVLREDLIGPKDFHGAAYYKELACEDLSTEFLRAIEKRFPDNDSALAEMRRQEKGLKSIHSCHHQTGVEEVRKIAEEFRVTDINFVKPGIGEATRVLLRRTPWKILIRPTDKDNPMLAHLLRLATEKEVPVETYSMENYLACGIIRNLKDV